MYLAYASTHPSPALEIDSLGIDPSSSVPSSTLSRAFQIARKHASHGAGPIRAFRTR